jgi:hypothetical protein
VVPILETVREENKGDSKFPIPSVHDSFLKGSNPSASSGIPENQDDESAVSQDQEN